MQRIFVLFLLLIVSSITPLFAGTPAQRTVDILVDKVHANDCSNFGLQDGEFNYHHIFGFRIAFDYLKHKGLRVVEHTEGRLDAVKLAACKVLFINLVSAERPPFYVSEIQAIVDFVRNGGSLFLITDHSNAYFHAWRLAPLLNEFDITSPTDTACDQTPLALGTGNGWILIENFDNHPITEGLQRILFQTGGCVDDRYAVAWTSENSWADAWQTSVYGEIGGMGFYGNWFQDEHERSGPLGVVLARQFEQGRIVIVGDQNIFGDPCIDYADNWRLWINAMAWLLSTGNNVEKNREATDLNNPEEYRKFRKSRILCVEDFRLGVFGMREAVGGYHLRALLARNYPVFTSDRYHDDYELLILVSGHIPMSREIVETLAKHLRRGRKLLALHSASSVVGESGSVLSQTLAKLNIVKPEFENVNGPLSVLRLKEGGSVYLLSPDIVVLNSMLPAPEKKPTDDQRKLIETFLEKLENAMF